MCQGIFVSMFYREQNRNATDWGLPVAMGVQGLCVHVCEEGGGGVEEFQIKSLNNLLLQY